MMRRVGFIICQVIVALRFHDVVTVNETEILKASESRYHPDRHYTPRNHFDYNDDIRRDNTYDRSLRYNEPPFQLENRWRYNEGNRNRRTFFQDYPHDVTTTAFPSLYQFMTSLFGGSDHTPDSHESYRYNSNRPGPPYPFQNPYPFRPTEPNYIPPPKPIRASVIKLESVTRSPIYSSFEGEATTKYHHNAGSILNHVLIENSKSHHHFGHPEEPHQHIPPFKPLPVLPKPRYTPPTATSRLPSYRYNETDYKYPDSVQDQLPHLQFGDTRIPYVSEKTIPQIFDTLPTEAPTVEAFGFTRETFRPLEETATSNILGLVDIRSFGSVSDRRRRPSGEADATTVRAFPGAVEKVERPVVKFRKKLSTHPDKISVERVTNLTVQGLSKQDNTVGNKQVNYLDVRDLIRYEMRKLKNTSSLNRTKPEGEKSKRPVNLNDELSLDAKILKDTNWDGLNVEVTTEVSEAPVSKAKQTAAFWEVVEGDSTTRPTTETTTVTTEGGKSETTTEQWFGSTRESTETVEPSTTTESATTPRALVVLQRRSENLLNPSPIKPVTEETLGTTTERAPRRRYSRRPKVVNFTPYPTSEEIQKKIGARSYFPKRQKPNITLAFGNKNVLRSRQSLGKEEVDEEVRKRRKVGKRRDLYKRKRVSSSERSVQEDSV